MPISLTAPISRNTNGCCVRREVQNKADKKAITMLDILLLVIAGIIAVILNFFSNMQKKIRRRPSIPHSR